MSLLKVAQESIEAYEKAQELSQNAGDQNDIWQPWAVAKPPEEIEVIGRLKENGEFVPTHWRRVSNEDEADTLTESLLEFMKTQSTLGNADE